MIVGLFEEFGEVGRTVQAGLLDRVLIVLQNTFNSLHTRIENVTIERETVGGSLRVRRHRPTKPIQRDLLVRVVELED